MLPKVLDLFSGCGGLTLGFEKAGFEIAAGIELHKKAVETISYNLDYRYNRGASHICGDITEIEGTVFNGLKDESGFLVIGGPPCQAYSKAGRGKLRSLGEDRVHTNDPRGYLYLDFLRFVYDSDAEAVIMENVPESVNFGGINIPQTVCEHLEKNGYEAIWTILNSADFGTPQVRERVIVIAVKREKGCKLTLPKPTHAPIDEGKTFYQRRFEKISSNKNFRIPVSASIEDGLLPWVTVGDALSDLPVLFKDPKQKYRVYPLNTGLPYRTEAQNEFQHLMRNWYEDPLPTVTGNAFRNTPRDFPIFDLMEQGDNYADATMIADDMVGTHAEMFKIPEGSEEYIKLHQKMSPQYEREKFTGKWRRLSLSKPSHTLVAHLEKDTYSHIHPLEPRGISVREAARLQSFPDDFFFNCNMSDAFRQIGNAVPPLLSYAVAKAMKEILEGE